MRIEADLPEIIILKNKIGEAAGKNPCMHKDFEELAEKISLQTKGYISSITLERLWKYSTRGYKTVSLYTLNLLSQFLSFKSWDDFCTYTNLHESNESCLFDSYSIYSKDLEPGDRLKIGWLPNRICVIRYLSDNRFVAEECHNSILQQGDVFECNRFLLHHPLFIYNIDRPDGSINGKKYIAGSKNGLILLEPIK